MCPFCPTKSEIVKQVMSQSFEDEGGPSCFDLSRTGILILVPLLVLLHGCCPVTASLAGPPWCREDLRIALRIELTPDEKFANQTGFCWNSAVDQWRRFHYLDTQDRTGDGPVLWNATEGLCGGGGQKHALGASVWIRECVRVCLPVPGVSTQWAAVCIAPHYAPRQPLSQPTTSIRLSNTFSPFLHLVSLVPFWEPSLFLNPLLSLCQFMGFIEVFKCSPLYGSALNCLFKINKKKSVVHRLSDLFFTAS